MRRRQESPPRSRAWVAVVFLVAAVAIGAWLGLQGPAPSTQATPAASDDGREATRAEAEREVDAGAAARGEALSAEQRAQRVAEVEARPKSLADPGQARPETVPIHVAMNHCHCRNSFAL